MCEAHLCYNKFLGHLLQVNMKCGLENRVTGASEPSRCEYAFDFETPARCTEPPTQSDDAHDEL